MNKISPSRMTLIKLGTALILMSIILLVLFFVNGQIVFTEDTPYPYQVHAIRCESRQAEYSYIVYDESIAHDTIIDIIYSNDKISNIATKQILYYPTLESVKYNEAKNHASINKFFNRYGLRADSLDTAYSMQDDRLIITSYMDDSDINEIDMYFFELNEPIESDMPAERLKQTFENIGFYCEVQ